MTQPDTRVVIAGEGELHTALAQQIRHHHLEKHVILAGFRPDILSLHKAFDVFVMSSVTEGLGTSLLDAMACARPIVATNVGGIPEVVVDGETGFLVPPRDPEALAAAIARLVADRGLREKMGAAGLARVRIGLQRRAHGAGIRSACTRARALTPSLQLPTSQGACSSTGRGRVVRPLLSLGVGSWELTQTQPT